MVSVIYSNEFLEHKTGMLHPERPERLTAIVTALRAFPNNGQLQWYSPTPVQKRYLLLMTLLEKIHSRSHIEAVAEIANRGGGYLDADTPVFIKSYDVALLAVSAWLDGIDLVLTNSKPAFILARSPGHHAESRRGMGFCLFSNAALAAHYALEKPDINKVAILDWDVHHGNGTQEIVETNENVRLVGLNKTAEK